MIRRWLIIVGVSLFATIVAFALTPADAGRTVALSGVVTLFAVGLWATAVIPEYLTALLLFVLALVLSIAPPEVVFSGFHSSAIWLIFGGFILGAAADKTGVGQWLASHIILLVGHSYRSVVVAFALGGGVLGFLIPSSMGRIMLLLPIVLSFSQEAGFGKGSNGRHGLLLAMLVGTYMVPMTILPANLPNVILLGTADTLYDHTITYSRYLVTHFPVTGILKAALGIGLIWWLFPAQIQARDSQRTVTPLNADGRLLLVILAITLGLWMTDTVHGVSPGWVALAAAVVCLLPGVDLVSQKEFESKVSLAALIYISGCIALGAIVASSGIGERSAKFVIESLQLAPDQDFRNYLLLSAVAVVTSLFVTMGGIMPVLIPIADGLAQATNWSLESVFVTFVNGASTPLLPYVSGPMVIALRLSETSLHVAARLTISLAAVTIVCLFPLNYFWFRLLGYF